LMDLFAIVAGAAIAAFAVYAAVDGWRRTR
jgi:hypothetical protein